MFAARGNAVAGQTPAMLGREEDGESGAGGGFVLGLKA